jgi:hypothetical protein
MCLSMPSWHGRDAREPMRLYRIQRGPGPRRGCFDRGDRGEVALGVVGVGRDVGDLGTGGVCGRDLAVCVVGVGPGAGLGPGRELLFEEVAARVVAKFGDPAGLGDPDREAEA